MIKNSKNLISFGIVVLALSCNFKLIEKLNINHSTSLYYSYKVQPFKKILELKFNSNTDILLDYKFDKKGIFLTYQRTNINYLSFFDYESGKENILFKTKISKNEIPSYSWLEYKNIKSNLDSEAYSFFTFKVSNYLIFIDKISKKIVSKIYIYDFAYPNTKIFTSKNRNIIYYINSDNSNLKIDFYVLNLKTLKTQKIFTKDLKEVKSLIDKDFEFYTSSNSNSYPFKVLESNLRNELILTNINSIDILDLNTFKLKRSIKIENKNYKFIPKNIIFNKNENKLIIGKYDFEISIIDLDKEKVDIFYEYKLDPNTGYDKYGEERIHLGNTSLQLSNDENYLLEIGDDDRSHLFDFKTKELLATFWADPYDEIKISEDSKSVIYSKVKDNYIQEIKYNIKNKVETIIRSKLINQEEKVLLKNGFYIKVKNIFSTKPVYENETTKIYGIDQFLLSNGNKEINLYNPKDKFLSYNNLFIYNEDSSIFGIFLYKDLNQKYITLDLFMLIS